MTTTTDTATDMLALWHHIYGDTTGYIGLFSGHRPAPGSKQLDDRKEQFYPYPLAAENAALWLEQEAARGREAYMCAHLLTDKRRIKANAAPVTSLWTDTDGGHVSSDFTPTAVVESSPGRLQSYFGLSRPIPPAEAEELNQRIAYATDSDPSGFDLTQLLRAPGTLNHKYEGAPTVKLLYANGVAYDPDDLDRILPQLPEAMQARAQRKASCSELTDDEAPIVLDAYGLATWKGENPKVGDGGTLDRSGSLVKIGRVLFDAGMTRAGIVPALRERDASLGWNKYSDRPDGEQRYQEIVDL